MSGPKRRPIRSPQRYAATLDLGRLGSEVTVSGDASLVAVAERHQQTRTRFRLGLLVVLSALLMTALVAVGLILWWPTSEIVDSRANMGASVLGGAIVGFAVAFVEVFVVFHVRAREEDLLRRTEKANLQLQLSIGDDFEGIDLSGRDLSGLYLRKKRLGRARMVNANLTLADLSGATMASADLAGAKLEYATLAEADLSSSSLSHARGLVVDLAGANLEGAQLAGLWAPLSDLSFANLRDADLSGANLNSSDLRGANLEGANLRGARLSTLISTRETIWPEGFDPNRNGVTVIPAAWAALLDERVAPAYELDHDDDGRILKMRVLDE